MTAVPSAAAILHIHKSDQRVAVHGLGFLENLSVVEANEVLGQPFKLTFFALSSFV
jgi:hypothetical protein